MRQWQTTRKEDLHIKIYYNVVINQCNGISAVLNNRLNRTYQIYFFKKNPETNVVIYGNLL